MEIKKQILMTKNRVIKTPQSGQKSGIKCCFMPYNNYCIVNVQQQHTCS